MGIRFANMYYLHDVIEINNTGYNHLKITSIASVKCEEGERRLSSERRCGAELKAHLN